MTSHDLLALARNLHRYRTAYDMLGDVWNESLPRDLRQAVGQDELKPIMQHLHNRIEALCRAIDQAAGEETNL